MPPVLAPAPPGARATDLRPRTSEGPGAISWEVTQRVAEWVGRRGPLPAPYRPDLLQAHFAEVTAEAEDLVEAATGLRSTAGPARAVVTDRPGWVAANIAAFQRLVGPHLEQLSAHRAGARLGLDPRWTRSLTTAGRVATGAQMGTVLGWLSTRVLGQYDVLVVDDAPEDQDVVYFVGPNVVALEREHGFDPGQFRLWLALHEVTHRCQFTAVPWLRGYFLSLVDDAVEPFQADPGRLAEMVRRAFDQLRAGQSPLDDAGVLGVVASERQLDAIRRLQAMMSILEGHGDVTMDRAGAAQVPGAAHFSQVLRERRQSVKGPSKVLQQVLGIEAKLRQYQQGEEFIRAVEARGGRELFDRVWEGPELLPTLAEIREPQRWIARAEAARDDA